MAVRPESGVETYSRLPVPRPVAGHHAEVPFYLSAEMYGGLPFELAGGHISDKVGAPVAAPHTHEVAEIYFLVSPNPGGARITVSLGGERHQLVSPATMRIPAGAEHCFVTEAAEPGSFCFGILLTGQPGRVPTPGAESRSGSDGRTGGPTR